MSDARKEYDRIKKSVAFTVNGYVGKASKRNNAGNEESFCYLFPDGSKLYVYKSLSGPFSNGRMFKFNVID